MNHAFLLEQLQHGGSLAGPGPRGSRLPPPPPPLTFPGAVPPNLASSMMFGQMPQIPYHLAPMPPTTAGGVTVSAPAPDSRARVFRAASAELLGIADSMATLASQLEAGLSPTMPVHQFVMNYMQSLNRVSVALAAIIQGPAGSANVNLHNADLQQDAVTQLQLLLRSMGL